MRCVRLCGRNLQLSDASQDKATCKLACLLLANHFNPFFSKYVHTSTQYLSNYILSSLICISIFDQPFYFVYIYTNLSKIYLRLNHKTWQHVGSVICPCLSLVYLSLCLFSYLIIINILIIFDIFLKVRRSVGRFVLISYKGGQLHFDASIGALVSSQRPQTFLCEQCSYACGDR